MINAYLSFGLLAVLYCRQDTAINYMQQQFKMPTRLNGQIFEVEMDKDCWVPVKYKYINGYILKEFKK